MEAPEQIVLDVRKMAESENYLDVPLCKLSPCHTMVAYTADTKGLETYTGTSQPLCQTPPLHQGQRVPR